MSGIIAAMVARKRARKADQEAFAQRRDEIIAAAKGEKGDPGPAGPMPDHEWDGTKLRFQKPEGGWGRWKDLKGPKGDDGKRVVVLGGGGSSGIGFDKLLPGAEGVEPTQIAVMQNGQWVSLPWAAFLSVVGVMDMATAQARRTDFVGETLIYRGEAAPGADESAAVWRIKRIEFGAGGDMTETWAGGTADFANVWTDRASLSYS